MKTIQEYDKEYICDISAPCFASLTPDQLAIVKTSRTQVKFRKGENLTKQGMYASYILFIVNGLAIKFIEGNGNKNLNLEIVGAGDFIGLSSIFTEGLFEYSATTLTDCHALLVEKIAISNVLESNAKFASELIKRYIRSNSVLYSSIQTLLFNQMNGKIAKALLYLGEVKKKEPDIFILLGRKEIAGFAGISVENAIKILRHFEKDQIIVLKEKDIEILNPVLLKDISIHG